MSQDTASFTRVLRRGDVIAVAFGAMIGFGWIVRTGDFVGGAGSVGAALAFVIGGIVIAFVGLTYAELVAAMPTAGGEHNYALRAMGSRPAFVTSWALVLGYVTVAAFEAVALPQTLLYLFPDMLAGRMWSVAGSDVHVTWVAVGIGGAVLMTVINYIGVRPAAVFQMVAVLFLGACGLTLLTGSFVGGDPGHLEPLFTGGALGVIGVLVATPFFYVGFDVIPQSAEEINVPARRIGQLLLVSVALAVVWYAMIMLTVGTSMPVSDLVKTDLASADGMAALWDSRLMGQLLVLGGIAGILTSWNAFLIGASRLVYAMAHSGMLPRWFGRLHPRFRTPSNALLFIGVLSGAAPLFGEQTLVWLVDAGGINIVVAFFMVAVSFVILRVREPAMERPFRVRGGVPVGVVAAVLALGLGVLYLPGMPAALIWPYEWVIVGLWWLLGLVFVLRTPSVAGGHDAEERLLLHTRRT
ncbi:MAG: amino acid permease [Streptosporangiales bacterium]|nr:amino acid permease [Streptosporangiales bacterium]